MEINSSINTFAGGMNMDADFSLLKENQYIYAENIRLLANESGTTGVLLNRDCVRKIAHQIEGKILGTVVTRIYNEISEEVVVIITEQFGLNSIYILTNELNNIKVRELVGNKMFGFHTALKIVANYESDTVSKIYVADGVNPIKVFNLNALDDSEEYFPYMFEILPNATLTKPELILMIPGQLKTGSVAYAYQLFQKNGKESAISPISSIINIPKTKSTLSKDIQGGLSSDISQYGCSIKIKIDTNTQFDYARIYRIRYNSNNDVAQVIIVLEQLIVNNVVYYQDTNDNIISEITVDEFNMLTVTEFVPQTIEKHENILFAANIKEKTWTGDYDARAYRCDKNGNIELHHSDSSLNIQGKLLPNGTIDEKDVPDNHDCINPSNSIVWEPDSFKYMYYPVLEGDAVVYKLGGIGKNIQYEFCYTKVRLSDNKILKFSNISDTSPDFTLTFNSSTSTDPIDVVNQDGDILFTKQTPERGVINNYSDSWFTTNFLGYQRDEIYRFGIVFYDGKHRKSPVYWIGDIRMPSVAMLEQNDNDNKISPFHYGENDSESTAYALGVKFKIKNMIEGAVKYEIVRCPRTETDRTIVAQGAISNVIQFDSWGDNDKNLGLNDIRPMSLLNCSDKYFVSRVGEDDYFKPVEDYFEFISPEVCVLKTNISDNLKNGILCNIMSHSCMQYAPAYEEPTLAVNQQWATRQQQIYTLDIERPYDYTNVKCGSYHITEKDGQYYPQLIHSLYGSYDRETGGRGQAILLKYYKTWVRGLLTLQSHNITDAVVAEPLPYIRTIDEVKTHGKVIGNKIYVNTTIGAKDFMNNHGTTAVIKTEPGSNSLWFSTISVDAYELFPPFTAMDATWVCNIKQLITPYGGNKYANRVNSTYINCVSHLCDDDSVCVFGGDTYLNIFDYTHTTVSQEENDSSKDLESNMFINCYIPLESSVNLNLLSTDTYNKLVEKASNSGENDKGLGQNLLQYEPTVTPNYTQTKPLYEYNSAYSADNNAQAFVPNLLYADENPIFETRIICSEKKINNEIVDSWTKFKVANYLDADNQYGPVTNLKSFNGKLFFWLDSAVGVASVNERSLIQDNNINTLTLGTGGVLSRYDYYATLYGSAIPNDKSICNSLSTLYWYDSNKYEICAINNTIIELSKNKGVKSWCNQLSLGTEVVGWYDLKYNEILFQNLRTIDTKSLVFNELLNVFTGFYTYPVSHVAQMTNGIITLDLFGHIYSHVSLFEDTLFESKLIYVVNKDYVETKVFDNVMFDALFKRDDVLSKVTFETKTQHTSPINYTNIDNREDTYVFPIGRNENDVARMRGKYLICDYTFDCKNEGDFKIPYIKTTFRHSRV